METKKGEQNDQTRSARKQYQAMTQQGHDGSPGVDVEVGPVGGVDVGGGAVVGANVGALVAARVGAGDTAESVGDAVGGAGGSPGAHAQSPRKAVTKGH